MIQLTLQSGKVDEFPDGSQLQCGDPDLFRKDGRLTDYSMPSEGEDWPSVLYITTRAGDSAPRLMRHVREIKYLDLTNPADRLEGSDQERE